MNEIQDIDELIEKLTFLNEGCENECLDLKLLKYEIEDGEQYLTDEFKSYFFKVDPQNPRDPKVILAIQQYCKLIGVPYNFFAKNPEQMKREIVECWLPTLLPEKSTVMAKLRKTKGGDYIIRALLPVEYTSVSNLEVIQVIAEKIKDFRIDFVIGDDKDDLVLHVRFISNEEFEICGENCSVGFSVVVSELGVSNLIVETLLHRWDSKSSFLGTYSTEAFFSFGYDKIQKNEINNLFPHLLSHLDRKLPDIKDTIQAGKEKNEKKQDINKLLQKLRLNKRLNSKFHTLLFQEIKRDGEVRTLWDFVNKMSVIAKDFSIEQRLRIERAAGMLLGLNFSKE
jgi:hypothetical protein